ncbi:MAG: helix-turn-helix transcriptional regulator [Prolixibacteraceae bacterium]|nr:helix-turn-helix transcriptional regulator [Prolixibacteraceae bacterium]
MKSVEFGSYLKQIREKKNIPQRKVAHRLDIDTSTLSKIELGERQLSISMIQGLADELGLDFRELQIKYISEKILHDFNNQPFLKDALRETINQIK